MLELVKYRAGYNKNQYLFDETSFTVSKGEIVGIMGLNGSGKSTFLKGIINLIPYKEGKILLNNVDIANLETNTIFNRFNIGYLSQRSRVFNNLTVGEHLKIQLHYSCMNNLPETDLFNNFHNIIKQKENLFASSLSGGEQLVLNLLTLMIRDPDIILLDEPSDSLDIDFKEELINLLLYWKSNNKAIVLIEQNIELLNRVSKITIKIQNYG